MDGVVDGWKYEGGRIDWSCEQLIHSTEYSWQAFESTRNIASSTNRASGGCDGT